MRRQVCPWSGKESKVSNGKNEEKRVEVVEETAPAQDQSPFPHCGGWESTLESRTPPLKKTSWENPNSSKQESLT